MKFPFRIIMFTFTTIGLYFSIAPSSLHQSADNGKIKAADSLKPYITKSVALNYDLFDRCVDKLRKCS
jgi:hypothetical protein